MGAHTTGTGLNDRSESVLRLTVSVGVHNSGMAPHNDQLVSFSSLLVLVSALSGCVSMEERRQAFNRSLDSWVGRHTDELITAKGPPTNSATLTNGGRVLEYSRSAIVTSGGGPYTTFTPVYVRNAQGGGTFVSVPVQTFTPVTSAEMFCKILVRASPSNRIESWSAEGNACY